MVSRGQMNEALDLGLPILRQLGHPFPSRPGTAHKMLRFVALAMRLRRWSPQALLERPLLDEPCHIAAARLSARLVSAAYLGRPTLSAFFSNDGVRTALDHGVSAWTPGAYAGFGIALAHSGKYESAQRIGRAALELADRLEARSIKPRVLHIYNAFLRPWREPLRTSLEPLLETHQLALDSGEFEYAMHALNIHAYYAYFSSVELDDLDGELERHRAVAAKLQQGALIHYLEAFGQAVSNLRNVTSGDGSQPTPWILEWEAQYQIVKTRV